MTAQLIDGKNIAKQVREKVAADVAKRTSAGKPQPGLATVLGGEPGRTLVAEAQQRYLTQVALDDEGVGKVYAQFDDVVIVLRPTHWVTWDIAKMNAERFDGKLGVESGYLYPLD